MSEKLKVKFLIVINRLFARLGYQIQSYIPYAIAFKDEELTSISRKVELCTMIEEPRIWSLMSAVEFICKTDVPGALVECGVWRGGAVMAMAEVLKKNRSFDRELWLYDTFAGLPMPESVHDISVIGQSALARWKKSRPIDERGSSWCFATLDDVKENMRSTEYPKEKIKYVQGLVENTVIQDVPDQIALLRLDLDWYEPTLIALQRLYPRLALGGILIIDDYGHWDGARRAVDDFIESLDRKPFLSPVDYSCRMAIK